MQLDLLGYVVRQAGNAEEALEWLTKEEFLLMITDIRLKNGTGFDLVKQLRSQNYTLPVLYITGFSGFSEQRNKDREILIKPFTGQELQQKINTILKPD